MQSAPRALLRIMGGLVNLGRITNCPLVFFEQRIEDLYISWYDLSWKIIYNYIKTLKRIYSISIFFFKSIYIN